MEDETVQDIMNDFIEYSMTKPRKPAAMIKKLIEISTRYDEL